MEKIFSSVLGSSITAMSFILCTAASLVLGCLLAVSYMFRSRYTKSFVVTLAMLPMIVQLVMMLVNGNIGTGIAVMGAFSLIRFRSAPGSAREILAIFAAMAIGLASGVGFIGIAAIFTVVFIAVSLLYSVVNFGESPKNRRTLKITVPESLDYTEAFSEVLEDFAARYELIKVKTTNMGSLYQLTYDIILRDVKKEKELIDALRCRNGNLEISSGRHASFEEEL